jgi:hypothetical protein
MSKRALCMGINNYPGTHMDLSGCVNDANDWAAELAGRGFAVSKLIDSQATKAAMVNAIQSLIAGGGQWRRAGDHLFRTRDLCAGHQRRRD